MHWLAHHTPGYLGADLEGLIRQSVKIGVKRYRLFLKNKIVKYKLFPYANVIFFHCRIYRKLIDKYIESQGLDPTTDCSLLSKFDSKYSSENSLDSGIDIMIRSTIIKK